MKKLLILDICDTLYSSNTTFDFLDFFSKENKLLKNLLKLRKNILFRILNKFFLKTLNKDIIKIFYIYYLKNKTKEEINEITLKFYNTVLKKKYKTRAFEKLKEYQNDRLYKIVIISGTLDFIAEVIAKQLNINSYFGTKLEIKNNLYTGKIEKDLFLEKEAILQKILNKNSYTEVDLMTDNITDYDLVKYTKKSIIVLNRKNTKFWKKRLEKNIIFLEENNE